MTLFTLFLLLEQFVRGRRVDTKTTHLTHKNIKVKLDQTIQQLKPDKNSVSRLLKKK